MEVFAISELRKEILNYCTGATLHPLRAVNVGFCDTINALIAAKGATQSHHTWSHCHHTVAVKRGCVDCIKHAVVNTGVNLGSIICGLCEYGYYGLAIILLPKLQFASTTESRRYYNAMYTLMYNVEVTDTTTQLKSLLTGRRRKMQLDPEYVWLLSMDQLFTMIEQRELFVGAFIKWISRNANFCVDNLDQVAFSDRIIQQLNYILVSPISVFVGIVCALFGRGFNVAAMRVLEAVAPFYVIDSGAELITAAIAAPGGDVNLYIGVCEFLRDYRLTQERFYKYMLAAITSEKYDICVELRKIAIACGLRYHTTYSQSFHITTTEQVRCANVFERSATCANVLNGIITATEYTAPCTLTCAALFAGLLPNSTQNYRRAASNSIVWSDSLDQLSIGLKYKFYYMLHLTPASLINLLDVYNGITIRAISIDLYTLYLDYGPHICNNYYTTLYNRADCIVSKVLLGMLSGNIPNINNDEIDNLWVSRYDLLISAAIRLRASWWLDRVYKCDEFAWERLKNEQIEKCGVVFYIPDDIKTETKNKKHKCASKHRKCTKRQRTH